MKDTAEGLRVTKILRLNHNIIDGFPSPTFYYNAWGYQYNSGFELKELQSKDSISERVRETQKQQEREREKKEITGNGSLLLLQLQQTLNTAQSLAVL